MAGRRGIETFPEKIASSAVANHRIKRCDGLAMVLLLDNEASCRYPARRTLINDKYNACLQAARESAS
jgi:hypothetical protein